MRNTLLFILLALFPLVLLAQEGDVIPEPDTIPEVIPDSIQGQDAVMERDAVREEMQDLVEEMTEDMGRPMVRYSPDFEFTDGLFLGFESVKENNPIPPARIVTDEDMFDRAFYDKVTGQKEITIYDEHGVKKVLATEDIWGYSRNGILYINVGASFHRISFMGSISHFVATVTTYNPSYYDPYYYNPYYSSSYYYNRYSMPQSTVASSDLRQYLLDFESGDVLEYDVESVEVLLMKDPELADEYHALRNRQKKQMKFVYIRRFNEKHPLYFPAD
jgi:hypothetical protein